MNPYENLEERAFWAPAVGRRSMYDISDLWRPKYRIGRKTETVTFGSCFAQHFARAMLARGFAWTNKEEALSGLSQEDAAAYNYGIFSARTGNIYTSTLLLQWVKWALGEATPPDEVWEKDGRFYDPFRPNIEPGGFASPEEVIRSREACIEAFRRSIVEPKLFVFTMGLTESWWHGKDHAYEYPMCPGTVAGEFDPETHIFMNQSYPFVLKNLTEAITLMRKANRGLNFLLTVSPVPLTATNSGNHVLVATMESKSILRSVAATVARKHSFVDYFPSYEIINSAPYRGSFFEPNMRSVNPHGVGLVMETFFSGLPQRGNKADKAEDAAAEAKPARKAARKAAAGKAKKKSAADLVCEEELLAAMEPGARS
ncbi:MAG: GSCFA domain-containing protein [Pseudooceanicola atlanticus]